MRHPATGNTANVNQLSYEYEGQKYNVPLAEKPLSLGRSKEADHTLPTKLASRIHAQIISREGTYWLEDLGSSNGTGLNGKILSQMTQLKTGDVIRIGDVQIQFEGDAPKPKGPPDHLIARIAFQPGQGMPAQEVLIRSRITVGRKPNNDLQINVKAISSQHLEIVNRNGLYALKDLASSNGTVVNGVLVKEATLRNGDQIRLGEQALLFFIDPAAAPQQPVPAPPQQPAQRPISGRNLSVDKAADKGVYSKTEKDAEPEAVSPVPYLVFGTVIGGLLLALGYFGGGLIEDSRQPKPKNDNEAKSITPLSDKAMSFEGKIDKSGNPNGWTTSFESTATTEAKLLADNSIKYDGDQSLRISLTNQSTKHTLLELTTAEARQLELGGTYSASLHVRGEGISSLSIGFATVDDNGKVKTLGSKSVRNISASEFKSIKMTGMNLGKSSDLAKVRLMISGSFSVLWIDRFELKSTGEGKPSTPMKSLSSTGIHSSIDAATPGRLNVRTDKSESASDIIFLPKLLAHNDRNVSIPDLWSMYEVNYGGATFRSFGTAGGCIRDVTLVATLHKNTYIPEKGVKFRWELQNGSSASASLAVAIKLPYAKLSSGDDPTVAVSDRFGTPLFLDTSNLHAYSYATISEIMVNGCNMSISFPEGAVVWFDFSHADELNLTVRSAQTEDRDQMQIVVNKQPLMIARQFQLLFDEAKRLRNTANCTAAKVRLDYIVDSTLPSDAIVDEARILLRKIENHRQDLLTEIAISWKNVSGMRNSVNMKTAQKLVLQFLSEFPGETKAVQVMQDRRAQLKKWAKELKNAARTPEEMAAAESQARVFFNDAVAFYNAGNILMALVSLDNVIVFFSDTSVYPEAKSMLNKINKELQDPVARDKVIDAALIEIDEDIKYGDWDRGRKHIFRLFKRFPDTPRNREIMQRLRRIEAEFED